MMTKVFSTYPNSLILALITLLFSNKFEFQVVDLECQFSSRYYDIFQTQVRKKAIKGPPHLLMKTVN